MPLDTIRLSRAKSIVCFALLLSPLFVRTVAAQAKRHNVIIFVADGLRRGSVNAKDMPTFARLRAEGVDFKNSHSVFPTFTTANASVIATGHGLGDTGDYSNVLYPGTWLTKPDALAALGNVTPFLENDEILADMNAAFGGNYLGERTLLSLARENGFNVASVGKLGPTAIQMIDAVTWDQSGLMTNGGATIIDDSTGQPNGIPLTPEVREALLKADLALEAPTRSNGYGESAPQNNGFSGDAQTAGTLEANRVQLQWFADVTTKALLPAFAAQDKPFALLFWSRDPDGTQHNHGDSLQNLSPGINGDAVRRSLANVDHDLKQLVDWLDAHPKVKAQTDIFVTSDHGFATISRREIGSGGAMTAEPSAALTYETHAREKPQPKGTLPTGFLAVDLALRQHMRVFDPAVRTTTGPSPYAEVLLSGETSRHPASGNALLGDSVQRLDGGDAKLVIAANGGSDLIYVPGKDAELVRSTVATLTELDYVGGVFVDDAYCSTPAQCAGALPLSAVGLVGSSKVPRPAIVVTYKVFYTRPGDLQSAAQISDTTLQEGQGMHGGFGRDQTLNNMVAVGPDFRRGFADEAPVGNIDIVPTLAQVLGLHPQAIGSLKGRVISEALTGSAVPTKPALPKEQKLLSAPTSSGKRTRLDFQEYMGVRYNDTACLGTVDSAQCF